MIYTIISELEVCNKNKGDSLTQKELLSAGANIAALIEAGHIKASGETTKLAIQEGAK